jgi:hypothetical protein
MVLVVQRGMYNSVTSPIKIPVLVPGNAENNDGQQTFGVELSASRFVRILGNDDLRDAQRYFTEAEAQHFHAVIAITQAFQKPDDFVALDKALIAYQKAQELRVDQGRKELDDLADLGPLLAPLMGLPPDKAVEHFSGLGPGLQARKDVRRLLSFELSESLDDARLVLWWTGTDFRPAIWCPAMKTGFYARALLSVVGGTGIRVCPHCGGAFLQERSDQFYCSIAHREAHRVARWRLKKKTEKSKKIKKRKNHGPGKAR